MTSFSQRGYESYNPALSARDFPKGACRARIDPTVVSALVKRAALSLSPGYRRWNSDRAPIVTSRTHRVQISTFARRPFPRGRMSRLRIIGALSAPCCGDFSPERIVSLERIRAGANSCKTALRRKRQ